MKSGFDFGFLLSTQIHTQIANSNNKTFASDRVQAVPPLPQIWQAPSWANSQSRNATPTIPKVLPWNGSDSSFKEEPPSAYILVSEDTRTQQQTRQTGLAKLPSSMPLGCPSVLFLSGCPPFHKLKHKGAGFPVYLLPFTPCHIKLDSVAFPLSIFLLF